MIDEFPNIALRQSYALSERISIDVSARRNGRVTHA